MITTFGYTLWQVQQYPVGSLVMMVYHLAWMEAHLVPSVATSPVVASLHALGCQQ